MKQAKGLSILIVVGKWARPRIQRGKFTKLRICLGFIAIDFYAVDMERWLTETLKGVNHETS